MNKFKITLLTVSLLIGSQAMAQNRRLTPGTNTAAAVASDASSLTEIPAGSTTICKGVAIPEGYVISGETTSKNCPNNAWIVKRRSRRPLSSIDRLSVKAEREEPSESFDATTCAEFQKTIASTYNFNPAVLNDAQRAAKSAELDRVWNAVRASRQTLVPCLRNALQNSNANSFFGIDGSSLLMQVDPSRSAKAIQVNSFTKANLDGIDLEYWVSTLAHRGAEGFDVSEAGAKWLAYPNAKFYLSRHGGVEVNAFIGAIFIFGSMDEDLATPTLLKIANQVAHPRRDDALLILMSQATPAAYAALKQVNTTGMSADLKAVLRKFNEGPDLLKPRVYPKLTREEQLNAFQELVNGDRTAFREMVLKAPDGEVDAVATLKPEDLPLLRMARRVTIANCNQHVVSDYRSFTAILLALTWKPELMK